MLNCWSRDRLNFDFLETLGNSFSAAFCVRYSKKNASHKKFYQLTKLTDHLLLLEILGNMCIVVEIKLIFQIKPFFYMSKKSRQKFKYLENEKSI